MPAPGVPTDPLKFTAYGYVHPTDTSTLAGYGVTVRLLGPDGWRGGFTLDDGTNLFNAVPRLPSATSAVTTGLWSMELYGLDHIIPAGSSYRFIQKESSLDKTLQPSSGTSINVTLAASSDFPIGGGLTAPLIFVLTSGSYADPLWITSLSWSKLTGTPTTLAGYGITDGATGGAWGTITGTLSVQTDLQAALNAKLGTGAAASTYQPLDADLTAIAGLTTTIFGRSLLTQADAAAARSTLGAGTGSGTVTAVSVASANGFTGTSTGGATPALTILAGAITPTSVNGIVFITPEKYGALGDGTTDDTTPIQAALTAAAAVGGTVLLGPKTYKITATLLVPGGVTLAASGVNALYGPIATSLDSTVAPIVSPYLSGSVLLMTTAATDAIHVTATGQSASLRNFGIRFADAIKFSNTGHGVVCTPAAYLTYQDNGLFNGRLESVYVFGHDGNHYAFKLINPAYVDSADLAGWGGGGLWIHINSPGEYGNSTFESCYFFTMLSGNAHGYFLDAENGGHPFANTFIRPQSFFLTDGSYPGVTYTSPSGGTQYNYYESDAVYGTRVVAGDFETVGAGNSCYRLSSLSDAALISSYDFTVANNGNIGSYSNAPIRLEANASTSNSYGFTEDQAFMGGAIYAAMSHPTRPREIFFGTYAAGGKLTLVSGNGVESLHISAAGAVTLPFSLGVTGAVTGASFNGNTITTGTGTLNLATYALTAISTGNIATTAYADALVLGLLDDRGNFDASGNVYPSSGGSGTAGAVLKGDLWTISVAGTLGGTAVTAGDVVRALANTPGQTAANWAIGENNFGYVALNQALASGKIYVGNGSNIGTAVTPSGDATLATDGTLTLATVNSNVGSFGDSTHYASLTVNGKGLITGASQTVWPTFNQNTTGNAATVTTNANLTGDVTSVGNATTLATVNPSNAGSWPSTTAKGGTFTTNIKGLITAAGEYTITPAVGSITGLGTDVATFLATPSSANLALAVTDETGSGALVFATSPTLTSPKVSVLKIKDTTGAGTNSIQLAVTETNTADRSLVLAVNDATRTLSLSGNVTIGSAFQTSGDTLVTNGFTYTLPGATKTLLATDGSGASLTALTAANITASTIVGRNLLNLTNPSAVTWNRVNADNTVSSRTAAQTLSDIGGAASGANTDITSVALTSGTFTTSLKSTTALATPSALSATQWTGFASTVSGAVIMGYGTTNDLSLMNRAGTVCLGVGPNTTTINIPGALNVGDGTVSAPSLAFSSQTNTGFFKVASSYIGLALGGVNKCEFGTGIYMISSYNLGWTGSITDPDGALTTTLSQKSSGILRVGATAGTSTGSMEMTNCTLLGTLAVTGASTLTGVVTFGDSGTGTASAGAVTLNKQTGVITTDSLTTAAGASYTLTITNSRIASTSNVQVTIGQGTNTTADVKVSTVTEASGSVAIVIYNDQTITALNGTLKIKFVVF